MGKKLNFALLSLLTILNVGIYFFRDQFSYQKSGTYSSLYLTNSKKWKQFIFDYPKQDLIEASKILDTAIDLRGHSTYDKILKIGKFLYNRFHKQRGRPSDHTLQASPLDQYKMLNNSDTEKLACGTFANMFAFFCWSEGIACRVIEVINPGDHHVVNECFLPETNEWVMTDVSTNQLLILNAKKNRFLNLLEVRDSLFAPLLCLQAADTSILPRHFNPALYKNYFRKKNPIYYYYRVNNHEVYKIGEKIKRYFIPVSWYEIVEDGKRTNALFYIKGLFILLWVVLFAALIIPKR